MTFSIDYILNGNLSSIVENTNNKPIVENFMIGGINADNTTTTLTENQLKNLSESTQNINESAMITNAAKLLNSVINNVVSKNQATLLQLLAATNNITMSDANIQGDLTIGGIDQTNTIDISANATIAQKIQNDIKTEISDSVTKQFNESSKNAATSGTSTDIGQTFGKAMDAVSAIGTSFIDNAGKIIDGSLSITSGNKTTTEKKNLTENTLKSTYNLNNSFTLDLNDEFNKKIENNLTTENLSKCSQEAQATNSINLSKINVKGSAKIENIKQSNFVNATFNCVFNQEVVNQLATIYVTNYSNLIDRMMQHTTTDYSGDVLAAGTAGAAMICAAGEAVSTGAQGLGSGISTAGQGIGSGIGNAIAGFTGNLMIGVCFCAICILILIGGGIYYAMSQQQNNNSEELST